MYEEFFAERLAKLRFMKNVSAREMSLAIGQNRNYINVIENGKAFPSMQTFFYICEYFQITPQEFFDEGNADPVQLNELVADLKRLDVRALSSVSAIVKEMLGRR